MDHCLWHTADARPLLSGVHMSAHSNLDREAFQTLLASAFSVQESGISKQSLSAVVEVQKSIAKHESFEGILALIADRARIVAGASGIAIGILTGHRLVYRAGSGSAARYVGRYLTAVLTLSGHGARKEILRVDNAGTDTRIEAAICREREARALLIIPIYRERVVAGVLEILFSGPHTFDDREIRTYWLMAGLVEEAMLSDIQRGKKDEPAIQSPTPAAPHPMEILPPIQGFCCGNKPDTKRPIAQVSGPSPTVDRTASTVCPTAKDQKTTGWHAKPSLFRDPRWTVDAALIVIVLALAAWISIHHPASPSIEDSPRLNGSSPIPKPSATILPENHGSKLKKPSGETEPASRARSPFTRVRVGPNEVDYIAKDVTIRHFATKAGAPHAHAVNKQFDIGDDVTVRIFTDAPAISPRTRIVSRR